jgi:mono/diheme cytochrome c family protein
MNSENQSPRRYAFPVATAVVLFGVFAVLLGVLLNETYSVRQSQDSYPQPTVKPPAEVVDALSPEPEETPLVEVTVAPEVADANTDVDIAPADAGGEGVVLDPAMISAGQTAFSTVCTACHGLNAEGVPGLGKDLVHSEFVNSLSDEDLAQFIIVGRDISDPANTTGIAMPGRGGNPAITDEQIDMIVVYLRSLAADAGVQPVHAGMSTGGSEASAGADTAAEADAPRESTFDIASWTAPVTVSGNFLSVDTLPDDVRVLYGWAEQGTASEDGLPFDPALFNASLLEPGNEAALLDYLYNDTGYLDSNPALAYPVHGVAAED